MSNAADSQAGLMGLRIIDVQVGAWCPTQDGTGPAQGVGMALTVARGIEKCDLVFLIRSPEAVNRLCESLLKSKNSVWPATPPAAHAACDEGPLEVAPVNSAPEITDGLDVSEWRRDQSLPELSGSLDRQLDAFRSQYEQAGGRKLGRMKAIEKLLAFAMELENLVEAMLEDEATP